MQSIMRMLLSIMMQRSVRTEDYSDSVAHVYMYVLGHDVMSTNHNLSCIIILLTISGQKGVKASIIVRKS